jgi:hypothetical protein
MPHLSDLTNGTPAKLACTLYFTNYLPDFFPINLTYILLTLSSKTDVQFLLLMAHQGIHSQEKFCYIIILYSQELLVILSTVKLQDDPFLAVSNWLFDKFTTTLHIWRMPLPSTTCGHGGDNGPTLDSCVMNVILKK